MNAERRKAIQAAQTRLEALRGLLDAAKSEAENLKADIETLRDEEQDYLDGMPESFQAGDKGTKAQEAIDALDAAIETLEEVDALDLDPVGEKLDEARA